MNGRLFTPGEIDWLRVNWRDYSDREIAEQLGRYVNVIKKKRQLLGLVEPGLRRGDKRAKHEVRQYIFTTGEPLETNEALQWAKKAKAANAKFLAALRGMGA